MTVFYGSNGTEFVKYEGRVFYRRRNDRPYKWALVDHDKTWISLTRRNTAAFLAAQAEKPMMSVPKRDYAYERHQLEYRLRLINNELVRWEKQMLAALVEEEVKCPTS